MPASELKWVRSVKFNAFVTSCEGICLWVIHSSISCLFWQRNNYSWEADCRCLCVSQLFVIVCRWKSGAAYASKCRQQWSGDQLQSVATKICSVSKCSSRRQCFHVPTLWYRWQRTGGEQNLVVAFDYLMNDENIPVTHHSGIHTSNTCYH